MFALLLATTLSITPGVRVLGHSTTPVYLPGLTVAIDGGSPQAVPCDMDVTPGDHQVTLTTRDILGEPHSYTQTVTIADGAPRHIQVNQYSRKTQLYSGLDGGLGLAGMLFRTVVESSRHSDVLRLEDVTPTAAGAY